MQKQQRNSRRTCFPVKAPRRAQQTRQEPCVNVQTELATRTAFPAWRIDLALFSYQPIPSPRAPRMYFQQSVALQSLPRSQLGVHVPTCCSFTGKLCRHWLAAKVRAAPIGCGAASSQARAFASGHAFLRSNKYAGIGAE